MDMESIVAWQANVLNHKTFDINKIMDNINKALRTGKRQFNTL